jgi:hypothetical protein
VDHRGALLGPEESGLGPLGVLGLFLLGHGHTDVSWCDGWLGPALTKLLVGSHRWVCCFPVGRVLRVCGGFGLVFLPVF